MTGVQTCALPIYAKSVILYNVFVAGSIYADEIVLDNCVVCGGVFATQQIDLKNTVVGTFNTPSIRIEGTVYLLLPSAFSIEKMLATYLKEKDITIIAREVWYIL